MEDEVQMFVLKPGQQDAEAVINDFREGLITAQDAAVKLQQIAQANDIDTGGESLAVTEEKLRNLFHMLGPLKRRVAGG